MSKRKWWVLVVLCTIVLLCGAAVIYGNLRPSLKTYADANGVKMKFKTEGTSFLVYQNDEEWKEVFAKGVSRCFGIITVKR